MTTTQTVPEQLKQPLEFISLQVDTKTIAAQLSEHLTALESQRMSLIREVRRASEAILLAIEHLEKCDGEHDDIVETLEHALEAIDTVAWHPDIQREKDPAVVAARNPE